MSWYQKWKLRMSSKATQDKFFEDADAAVDAELDTQIDKAQTQVRQLSRKIAAKCKKCREGNITADKRATYKNEVDTLCYRRQVANVDLRDFLIIQDKISSGSARRSYQKFGKIYRNLQTYRSELANQSILWAFVSLFLSADKLKKQDDSSERYNDELENNYKLAGQQEADILLQDVFSNELALPPPPPSPSQPTGTTMTMPRVVPTQRPTTTNSADAYFDDWE